MVRSFGSAFLVTIHTVRNTTITSQSMRRSIARLRSIRLYFCIAWPSSCRTLGGTRARSRDRERFDHHRQVPVDRYAAPGKSIHSNSLHPLLGMVPCLCSPTPYQLLEAQKPGV